MALPLCSYFERGVSQLSGGDVLYESHTRSEVCLEHFTQAISPLSGNDKKKVHYTLAISAFAGGFTGYSLLAYPLFPHAPPVTDTNPS